MHRFRLLLAGLYVVVILFVTPNVMSFDIDPTIKWFFEERPVSTVLNLGTLPGCCLANEAAYEAELAATLALIPDTPCTADGDLLVTPFETDDPRARPRNDGTTVVRFKNQGVFTLGVTTLWIFGETQSCGVGTFNRTADADVDLNRKVNWVKDPGTGSCPVSNNHFSLRSTALHELGHVVGLEHTNIATALMFAFGDPCDFDKDDFLGDDLAQFDFIYACEGNDCQRGAAGEPEPTEKKCKDEVDNDGDGLTDCNDPDCASRGFCRFQ